LSSSAARWGRTSPACGEADLGAVPHVARGCGIACGCAALRRRGKRHGRPVEGIPVSLGGPRTIALAVTPLSTAETGRHFRSPSKTIREPGRLDRTGPPIRRSRRSPGRIFPVETELTPRSVSAIHHRENCARPTRNAQSTNEELLSSNEELQTAKEELQASTTELHTLNAGNGGPADAELKI